jgi:subtilase family serine protease
MADGLVMRAIAGVNSRALLVGLVTALAIVGFAFAGLPGSALAGPTGHPGASSASAPKSAAPDLSGGPLTPVAGSGTSLSPTQPTTLGTVTVTPDDAAYNANAQDMVTVTLAPSQSLSALVNAQSDVASAQYRHFLSTATLGAQYGNPDYASVEAYFGGFGLSVTPSDSSLTMSVSGTVAQISAAFHTSLAAYSQTYTSGGNWNPSFGSGSGVAGSAESGPVIYTNIAPAELPVGIAGVVNGIAGLDQMVATPEIAMPAGLYPGLNANIQSDPANATIACTFGAFGGPCNSELDMYQSDAVHDYLWTDFTPAGLTCADYRICGDDQMLFPSSMAAITGATSLWSGADSLSHVQDRGQGITIAVIEVGCAFPSDLSAWSNMSFPHTPDQLANRLTQIALDVPGLELFPNTNLVDCEDQGLDAGWTLETSLDVEYAAAMAPQAHIDVVGIPYPGNFSAFDLAYADVAQYLSLGSTGGSCPGTAALAAANLYVVQGTAGSGTCAVTITSNSYGEGEEYQYFYGSPIYLTAATEELQVLNAVGVTNFFASGDGGGTDIAVNDFASADSLGATSVGGAQITAEHAGTPFPITSTNFTYCDGELLSPTDCYGANGTAYFATVNGIASTGYWAYGEGLTGTYTGVEGGGFGQSLAVSQPWWQNALDTYSTGSKIDPVVSLAAAFNMTIYGLGSWYLFYGGTSFACPTMAAEWALIEEQANLVFGNPEIGDANPLLYAAHNAYEAHAVATNPYTPDGDDDDFTAAPVNSFTWYYYNLSIEVPSAPVQPVWFPSLANPAGSGWNYLQGLGIPNVAELDLAYFGTTGSPGHALANPAFGIFEVTSGGLVPVPNTLSAGTTYNFQVLNSNGRSGVFDVSAYSGQSSNGAYGGGTVTTYQTAGNGKFSYTPTTGTPPGGAGATTYGYFLVKSVVGGSNAEWAFDSYAVAAPTPTGTLTLCVVDPYGNCDQGVAEVTTFTTTTVGDYNLFGQAQVYLNGLPVSGAVVTQVSVYTQYGYEDESLPPADYAPGMTLGTTLSDARGEATFWIDGFTAEHNGTLRTDIYTLTATYDGLTSNTTIVYAEPQSGSFYTADLSQSSGTVSGELSFAGMKYVDSINVSVGSSPGQYDNWTCPLPSGASQPANTMALPGCTPFYDTQFGANLWESGVDYGTLPVSLSTTGITGPVVVNILGVGSNDVTFGYCETFDGETFCFADHAVQRVMSWTDPVVFLPASVSASATGTVAGVDSVSWNGASYTSYSGAEIASGSLSLVWAGGSEVLATTLTGTLALDTTSLANGAYSLVYAETAPGAVATTSRLAFNVDNSPAATPPPPATPSPHSAAPFLFGLLAGENLLILVGVAAILAGSGAVYLASRRRSIRPPRSRGGPEETDP